VKRSGRTCSVRLRVAVGRFEKLIARTRGGRRLIRLFARSRGRNTRARARFLSGHAISRVTHGLRPEAFRNWISVTPPGTGEIRLIPERVLYTRRDKLPSAGGATFFAGRFACLRVAERYYGTDATFIVRNRRVRGTSETSKSVRKPSRSYRFCVSRVAGGSVETHY